MVDSTDRERLSITKEELHRMLESDELCKAALLVFANKQVILAPGWGGGGGDGNFSNVHFTIYGRVSAYKFSGSRTSSIGDSFFRIWMVPF